MLKRGVIKWSCSPCFSNVVLIRKKDNTYRFCVDYRLMNEVTVRDAYPLPRIDECLDSLSGMKWFSYLNVNSGFWQTGMAPDDIEKTDATSLGLYQFTVMPFGLTNPPSTFLRLREDVLRGLQLEECLLYLDDIIVPGSTFDQTVEKEHFFLRLREVNLILEPSKCIFNLQTSFKFLWHINYVR